MALAIFKDLSVSRQTSRTTQKYVEKYTMSLLVLSICIELQGDFKNYDVS